jgi:hypothetical protein
VLPADDSSPHHFTCDVRKVLASWDSWDLMIAHPPCTYLANSGVRWLYSEPLRWQGLVEGAAFFRMLLDAPIARIAVENPVMHKWARMIVGRDPTQTVQPYHHGHGETKATCLWLKGLPELRPTNIVAGRTPRVHYESPGADRWKRRSVTYQGIAEAMAEAWGSLEPIQAVA